MKAFILIAAILLPTSALAFCDDWTPSNTIMESAFISLIVVDWAQTKAFMAEGKLYETNPILGRHPSQQDIDIYMAAATAAQIVVTCLLPKPWREVFQVGSIGIEIWAVGGNASFGVRGHF